MDRRSSTSRRAPDTGEALSRRKIVKGAVGVAAAGAAGSVLTQAFASPARAASTGAAVLQSTTVEPGSGGARGGHALTDAATISVDASQGNDFRVTLGASRTMGNPANPANGQQIIFQITQGSGGSATITWGTAYEFSTGLPQPTLSTAAGQTDLLGFIYNAAKRRVAAGRIRERIQLMTTYRLWPSTSGPSSRHLLQRELHLRHGILRHVRGLVHGLLVVGLRLRRPEHRPDEVRAVAGAVPEHRESRPRARLGGHQRDADRRAVELHPAARRRSRCRSAAPRA